MSPIAAAQPGLVRTLTIRLAITTVLVLLLQSGFVAVRDYINETDFLNSYVRREAQSIGREYWASEGEPLDAAAVQVPGHYFGADAHAYAFRVMDARGKIIAEHNGTRLQPLSPWSDTSSARQDLWIRKLDPDARMHVAGGLKVRSGDRDLWVELATFGDPASTYLRTMALEILDDVWLPMLPLVALSLAVTVASVRKSFRPLVAAASEADKISVLERSERLDVSRLPAEASHFASAINRLLDRVADLVSSQRLFIARAAHELRTPLSIMMLELGHLKDPSGKRLEGDVRAMSEIVDQLLSLARLDATPRSALRPVDVATVVRELVSRMLEWSEMRGHRLEFAAFREAPIEGDEAALRDAVRNLIENAVKHTPPGTRIRIEVAKDASIIVEDSGPGVGAHPPEELQLPFRKGSASGDGAGLGLAIVRQAAELHGGRLDIGRSSLGGARFVMNLHQATAVPAA